MSDQTIPRRTLASRRCVASRLTAPVRPFALALPLALTLGACGGGGGGGSSISVGFTSSDSSSSEGTTANVVVELKTGGKTLEEEVSVVLSDAGTGSATAGVDYTAMLPLTVSFPVGSEHLDTVTLFVNLVDDSTVEGADESVELMLADPSEGLKIKNGGAHSLTVEEGDFATLEFAEGSTTTPDEGDATYTTSVTLSLEAGDVLGTSASVVVSDRGQGTATSGADYDAFADQTISFAAGTTDGASVDVSLTVRDDTSSETHETAILELVDGAPGVVLGTNAAHVLTITEDDASPDPFLVPMGDDSPGGSLVSISSGDDRDFGSQTLSAGPGDEVRIELTNAGLQEMSLSALQLSGDTRDFRIETQVDGAPTGFGMGSGPPLEGLPIAPLPFDSEPLAAPVGMAFEYAPALAAAFEGESALLLDGLVTPAGEVLSLAVGKRPLPIADDAVLSVDGVPVPGGFADTLAGVSVWTGGVVDELDSEVFLALSPAGMQGWVRFGEAREYETLHLISADGGDLVIVADDVDVAALAPAGGPAPCAGSIPSPGALPPLLNENEPGTDNVGLGVDLAKARLAIETDYHLYSTFGDATQTTTYVTQLIAAVADAYERDVQAALEIVYLGVYTTASDPWSSGDSPGDSTLDLLDEFQLDWSGNGWPVSADLAHFISGANLGGGIAYVDVLCSQVYGFGVSANINGNIDWGTFTGASSPLTWDFVVVAHELGHNFGASHTHSYCPPLDVCASNCNGGTSCSRSTLMSYCHTCGGLSNIDLRFHPFNADIIRDEIAGSCLGDATLAPGSTVTFDVTFDPVTSTGGKSATISFTHDAVNEASPFSLDFSGTAQN